MNTRDKFHAWLATQGYRDDIKPLALGSTYASSHVQALWDCWLAAQPHWHPISQPPVMDRSNYGWPNSRVVLVFNGRDFSLAYLEQPDEDTLPLWRDNGSEGWELKGLTHWANLQRAPS
jgi:hypothetical protein